MKNIKLLAEAFKNNEPMPTEYTCDGDNISPKLSWDDVPEGTKSITLIVDDLDGPNGTFEHWVLFNIPPDVRELPKGMKVMGTFGDGSRHGINGFGRLGYGGPCPSNGIHVYNFRIYALDTTLSLIPGVPRNRVDEGMRNHKLNKGKLVGIYKRQRANIDRLRYGSETKRSEETIK